MKPKKEVLIQAIAEGMVIKMALEGLDKAFYRFGIEGTEQRIRELYKNTPKTRDMYLGIYHRTLKKGI